MIMKRVLFIFAILGLTTMIAFGQDARIRENRQVSGFTGINASGMFNITVQRGNTESLVIETYNDIMSYVRSEVRNGVLYLSLDRNFPGRQHRGISVGGNANVINMGRDGTIIQGNVINIRDGSIEIDGVPLNDIIAEASNNVVVSNRNIGALNVTVVMPNLEQVTLSGASNLTANDLFTPNRFKSTSSGAANITLNLNTNNLEIGTSGISNININANVSGYTRLDISGASNIRGSLVTEQANFNFSGTSNVVLNGSAANANVNVSGTSNVNLVNFPIRRTALANVSGVSDLRINAVETLIINASGMSNARYTGSATVQRNVSRNANVRRL